MRILIASGSSGGHIYPALALARSLKTNGAIALLVLPRQAQDKRILVEAVDVEYISAANLNFSLTRANIRGWFKFLKGTGESLRIILKFRPEVVVGFGSLHTIALLFWAWLFRIKTVIHEQNVIPGRANRLLAKFADKVAVSFTQTKKFLPSADARIVLTGNLIRQELVKLDKKEALDFFKFKEGKFTILITGGSQGAHKLNQAALAALEAFYEKKDLQIIHICGVKDFPELQNSYSGASLSYRLFDFFPVMQYAYSAAELIICRAGATTIAELQKFNLPAVLIPYPFAYAHQLANARVLEDIGCADVISDADLTAGKLQEKLKDFLTHPQKLISMRQAYAKMPVLDALDRLTKEVLIRW